MDLLAIGTPAIDMFARAEDSDLRRLGLVKGATNRMGAKRFCKVMRLVGKRIAYEYPGDNARNVCEGFAALGGFCGYCGAVGNDRAAALFRANLADCGIASFVQGKRGRTGRILALLTPDGQRTFAADLGASTQCDRLDPLALEESRMLYAASITLLAKEPVGRLALRCLEAAKRRGKRIAISLESPPMVRKNRGRLLRLLEKYAGIIFLNEEEAASLLGSGYEARLPALKPSALLYLKRGAKGSSLFHKGKQTRVPPKAARVIDSTGAGDAYAAGVLYGLSRLYSPLSSAKIGCMLAAKVVEKMGAGIPMKHAGLRIRL